MEIKTLAKNTFILATPKVVAFAIGILKSKLIAILLGTTGFGIVDQLTNSVNQIRNSTLSFLPDGMVKLIAKQRSQNDDIKIIANIVKTYLMMILPILILVLVLSIIFIDELTIFVLGDLKYKHYLIITLIAVPVTFIGASFAGLLKAYKEIKAIALRQIYVLILNLIAFVPLVYYFEIKGAVIYVSLSFMISMLVAVYLVKKHIVEKYGLSLKLLREAIFSKLYFKELLTFISVGIIAGTFKTFELMTSRAIVVNELGIDQIGIYAPITKWQALFLGFILPSIYTYLYPRLSEALNNKEIVNVLNAVIRMITFLTLPFVLMGITTREWIIPIFYSNDFMEAAIYLPFHFSFLLVAVWSTIFEQLFASTGRLKTFLVFVIIINTISLLLIYYFVPRYGLFGYLLRYTVTPCMFLFTYFIFWRSEIRFSLRKENLMLVTYSAISILIVFLMKDMNNFIQFATGISLIGFLSMLLKKSEQDFLIDKLKRLIGK